MVCRSVGRRHWTRCADSNIPIWDGGRRRCGRKDGLLSVRWRHTAGTGRAAGATTVITEGSVTVAGDLFANILVESLEISGVRGRPDTSGLALLMCSIGVRPNRCRGLREEQVQWVCSRHRWHRRPPPGRLYRWPCARPRYQHVLHERRRRHVHSRWCVLFTAGTPNMCSTTLVSACAAANADEATSLLRGHVPSLRLAQRLWLTA